MTGWWWDVAPTLSSLLAWFLIVAPVVLVVGAVVRALIIDGWTPGAVAGLSADVPTRSGRRPRTHAHDPAPHHGHDHSGNGYHRDPQTYSDPGPSTSRATDPSPTTLGSTSPTPPIDTMQMSRGVTADHRYR